MPTSYPSLRRLNQEWQDLATAPLPREWSKVPDLRGYRNLAAVLDAIRSEPDAVLAGLLRVGDAAAHRVVLQTMLGWAVRAAARDRDHDLDDYLAELWLTIAGYPLARRPARIAANLALDTRKRVRERPRSLPVDPTRFAQLPDARSSTAPRAELVLARARRVELTDDLSDLALRLVYTRGLDSTEAAALLGLTPPALRQRCHRALRRLAAHADLLKEVVS